MPTWLWWVIGLVVVVLVAALLARRTAVGRVDPTELTFTPDTMAQVRRLAATDRIAAVKALRAAAPGLGLAQATVMVDRMVAAPAVPLTKAPDTPLDLDVELRAQQLKHDGQTIAAITLIRESTGWGLAQAKDYVDRL